MAKNTFTLWTDRNGNELHLEKHGDTWRCTELSDAQADIASLLRVIASAEEPNFAAVEAIARNNGFTFDDNGDLIEKGDD